MNLWSQHRFRRGFTLVELMIAMALVGVLTAAIYALFVQTADSLRDVEGHSAALEQARHGIEQVRIGLSAAGSHATPNAEEDPWILSDEQGGPEPDELYGILQYDNMNLEEVGFGEEDGLDDEDHAESEFSDVIVVGAFDVPASLFVSFTDDLDSEDDEVELYIEGTERGLHRMLGYDPFDDTITNEVEIPGDLATNIEDRTEERLLRINDSEGFSQIRPVEAAEIEDNPDGAAGGQRADGPAMRVDVSDLYFRQGDEPAGFDVSVEDDVSFDAALIDAYRFSVRAAPDNSRNLQLVRQRLDATDLIGDQTITPSGPPLVLAERVVDFRVWFDCRTSGEPVVDAQRQQDWNVVGDDCVRDNDPHLAQIAHARLSTRTASENPNRPHLTVADGDDWDGFEQDEGQMRTFELYPAAEGSAGVVTTQTSVELTNFSMRALDGV